MPGAPLVDAIGAACTVTRRTEPRIAGQVRAALGDARTVLNAGAGTGSYEPPAVTSPRPDRRRSCGPSAPQRRAWLPPRRASRSRTGPDEPFTCGDCRRPSAGVAWSRTPLALCLALLSHPSGLGGESCGADGARSREIVAGGADRSCCEARPRNCRSKYQFWPFGSCHILCWGLLARASRHH